MAKGREIIIAVSDGALGFDAISVTAARSLRINNELVDITKPDALNPGAMLVSQAMYGTRQLAYSGAGAFVNQAAKKKVMTDAVNQVTETYRITIPEVGTFTGDGLLGTAEFSGDLSNEMQDSFELQMSGDITFTPAV